jgi:hypothetical protein
MLAMVFTIPGVFALAVWRSFKNEATRRARGEIVSTPGARRWTDV